MAWRTEPHLSSYPHYSSLHCSRSSCSSEARAGTSLKLHGQHAPGNSRTSCSSKKDSQCLNGASADTTQASKTHKNTNGSLPMKETICAATCTSKKHTPTSPPQTKNTSSRKAAWEHTTNASKNRILDFGRNTPHRSLLSQYCQQRYHIRKRDLGKSRL